MCWSPWNGAAFPIKLHGVDELIAACARNDADAIAGIADREPQLVHTLLAEGGTLLAEFAGNGNTEGVRRLLDLGVSVSAPYKEGDGYFEIAKDSTALHVAAWRARHETLKLLLERGAKVNALDARGTHTAGSRHQGMRRFVLDGPGARRNRSRHCYAPELRSTASKSRPATRRWMLLLNSTRRKADLYCVWS